MPYLTPDAINGTLQTRLLTVSIDDLLRAAATGQIFDLTEAENWRQAGVMTPGECAAYFQEVFWDFMNSGLLGIILPYAGAQCPAYALPCDGSTYNKATNPIYGRLYDILDAFFIIDADRFTVPDCRGRVVLASETPHPVGETGGEETHTLIASELPTSAYADTGHSHTPTVFDPSHTHVEAGTAPTLITIGAGVPAPSAIPLPSVTAPALTGISVTLSTDAASITNTGGDGPHENMMPYLSLPMCIVYR